MIDAPDTYSLADFNRDATSHIERLKASGLPEVLTVDGEVELVVQSADAYRQLVDRAELAEMLPILRKSLAEAKRGEGRPARDVLREIAAADGIELDR